MEFVYGLIRDFSRWNLVWNSLKASHREFVFLAGSRTLGRILLETTSRVFSFLESVLGRIKDSLLRLLFGRHDQGLRCVEFVFWNLLRSSIWTCLLANFYRLLCV